MGVVVEHVLARARKNDGAHLAAVRPIAERGPGWSRAQVGASDDLVNDRSTFLVRDPPRRGAKVMAIADGLRLTHGCERGGGRPDRACRLKCKKRPPSSTTRRRHRWCVPPSPPERTRGPRRAVDRAGPCPPSTAACAWPRHFCRSSWTRWVVVRPRMTARPSRGPRWNTCTTSTAPEHCLPRTTTTWRSVPRRSSRPRATRCGSTLAAPTCVAGPWCGEPTETGGGLDR